MLEKNFEEFATPNSDQWEDIAIKSLKGKPLSKLEKSNYENYTTKVIYHNTEFENKVNSRATKLANKDFDWSGNSIIDASVISSSGGNSITQIAFCLYNYLHLETENKIIFVVNSDSNTFVNISKLRALRKLVNALKNELKSDNLFDIYVKPTPINKTILDKENNILRITNECFSSMLGGADYFETLQFDLKENDFSIRISENIFKLLSEESLLNLVNDPVSGSYYIEEMTEFISQNSWDLFLDLQELNSVDFTSEINEFIHSNKEIIENDYYSGSKKLVGVNVFSNPLNEFYNAELNKFRISSEFENFLKLKENYHDASITIISLGEYKNLKPRVDFVADFFKVGSFSITEYNGFETLEDTLNTISIDLPKVLVVCSEDDKYKHMIPDIKSTLDKFSSETELIVAGYPKDDKEFLEKQGVSRFIHIKSNILEELKATWRHFEKD